MKTTFRTLLFCCSLIASTSLNAQEITPRVDKFYSMSGFGFSIPVGESSNIGLGNGGLFLYPKISLHVFGYDNTILSGEYNYNISQARSTTYLLNLAIGYRKIVDKFAFYGFVGGGGGFILTPRLAVNTTTNSAKLNNRTNHMGIIEPGAGVEYNIGGANLFIESSYMYGLGDVGGKPFNAVPLTIGIKPNLSRLFYPKK